MPRGIPNVKRDDTGLKHTTFHVTLQPNPRHGSSGYLKSESQTIWARNAASKPRAVEDPDGRGAHVIVIHPGSRHMQIGRASDVTPTTIPAVVAHKYDGPVPRPSFSEGVARPRKSTQQPPKQVQEDLEDEYAVSVASEDPFEERLAHIVVSLRQRMRFYKLRVVPNANEICHKYNSSQNPELIQEYNDPYRVDWITASDNKLLIGEEALRIADPQKQGYIIRSPFRGRRFNTKDYSSVQLITSDVETLISHTLSKTYNIKPSMYKDYSAVLVIPDFWEREYVREMINLLVGQMGFKQICIQQESLAATYGSGISVACVVDIGASTTTISCVDDGAVVADTRMVLNMGSNDITEFLYVLLERVGFPYRDADLALWYDYNLIETLKAKLITLAEGDVGLNLYDFIVRRPGEPARKYGLKAYDEIILAPMCLFEPRVIEFDRKRVGFRPTSSPDVTEDILEQAMTDQHTAAMRVSTHHLIPQQPPESLTMASSIPDIGMGDASTEQGQQSNADVDPAASSVPTGEPPSPSASASAGNVDAPIDIESLPDPLPSNAQSSTAPALRRQTSHSMLPSFPTSYGIDIIAEAAKLPLDVAIFNSARSAGGEEKLRKYLQSILVVGGGALVPGMQHAVESRLQAIATPLVPNMEKVQVIPPPKDVDPRVLIWKGAAVLGKMDSVADLWVTASEWDVLGMRGIKEKLYYLC